MGKNDEMEQIKKAREEYERHKVLKGVDKLNWDVCLYYIEHDGIHELGIMRGTSREVAKELIGHHGNEIRIMEIKLNELIKGLYEQGKRTDSE